jgi:hypothetical protein
LPKLDDYSRYIVAWKLCTTMAHGAPVTDTDRLAGRPNLTDPQKAALKDLTDASASADASAKIVVR